MKRYNISAISTVLLCVGACALPPLLNNNYTITVLNQALINTIIVFGLNFITGMTGQTTLGTAGVYALGGYTTGLLTTKLGLSPWAAIPFVLLMGWIIGLGLGYPSLKMRGVYLSLTTISFGEIVRIFLTNLADFTGGTQGVRNIPKYSLFGLELRTPFQYFYFLLAMVVLFGVISYIIIHSKWGRAFVAVRDNIDAMEACGINVANIKVKAFTLASVYGCVAGALYAHFISYINPTTYTRELSVIYVAMLAVGGAGSLSGCVLGAVLITVLPEALRFLGDYYQITYSMIVLLCAIFLPGGLAPKFSAYMAERTGKRKGAAPTAQ